MHDNRKMRPRWVEAFWAEEIFVRISGFSQMDFRVTRRAETQWAEKYLAKSVDFRVTQRAESDRSILIVLIKRLNDSNSRKTQIRPKILKNPEIATIG